MARSALSANPPDVVYYYINDHLGTPLMLIDESNNIVWRADYRPFGTASVTTSTVENKFRFPGQYQDEENGLHYNWHRYYNAQVGRYISADPIGQAGGINLFVYVRNNPINWQDPLGLRRYTILDVPDPSTLVRAKHFQESMRKRFKEAKKTAMCEEKEQEWEKLIEEYSLFDAVIDSYRYDEKEAIDHYKEKIGESPLFWGTGAGNYPEK